MLPAIPELVVRLLAEARAHEQMQQLLQYRILPDCLAVASATLGAAGAHAPLRQLGLDMLYRLNEHALIEQCAAEGRGSRRKPSPCALGVKMYELASRYTKRKRNWDELG